jgi:hypothetical protein
VPNDRVHIDLFGPLKTSPHGKKFILCITDAFTKYAEVVSIENKEASTVAKALMDHWICRFGSPIQFHSDGGKEFVNKLSQELFQLLDIKHTKTSPAHPQANAQVEVFNKTVAKYLSSFVDGTTLDWEQYIPALMFAYNTSYHSTIMTTPFELLYGLKPRTPSFPGSDIDRVHYGESFAAERLQILQAARQIAKNNIDDKNVVYKEQYDRKSAPHTFQIGDLVYYDERNFLNKNAKLAPKWLGPVEITHISDTNATVKMKNGKLKIFHLMRIKKFHQETPRQDFNYDSDDEKFEENEDDAQSNEIFNQPPVGVRTRALTRLLEERHTINYVEIDLRHKLSGICEKLYRHNLSINQLTPEEKLLWTSYELEDILFFLFGHSEKLPDYSSYIRISKPQRLQPNPPQQHQGGALPPLLLNLPGIGTPALTPPRTPLDLAPPVPPPQLSKSLPWDAFRGAIDARNIIKEAFDPLKRLTRSKLKKNKP